MEFGLRKHLQGGPLYTSYVSDYIPYKYGYNPPVIHLSLGHL